MSRDNDDALAAAIAGPDVATLKSTLTKYAADVKYHERVVSALASAAAEMKARAAGGDADYVASLSGAILELGCLRTGGTLAPHYYRFAMAATLSSQAAGCSGASVVRCGRVFLDGYLSCERFFTAASDLCLVLDCVSCILDSSSTSPADASAAAAASRAGASAYRALGSASLRDHLDSGTAAETVGAAMKRYLLAQAASFESRERYLEAAKALHTRFAKFSDKEDLLRCAWDAILATPCAGRHALVLTVLDDMGDAAGSDAAFGPLLPVLRIVGSSKLLDAHSKAGLVGFRPQAEQAVTKAVARHNLVVVSTVYEVIKWPRLTRLLLLASDVDTRASIIGLAEESGVSLCVDEKQHVIRFMQRESTNALEDWDSRISSICSSVTRASDMIMSRYPQFSLAPQVC